MRAMAPPGISQTQLGHVHFRLQVGATGEFQDAAQRLRLACDILRGRSKQLALKSLPRGGHRPCPEIRILIDGLITLGASPCQAEIAARSLRWRAAVGFGPVGSPAVDRA